ncbi:MULTISPECIES: DUF4097 family beta strand repeat-containing protein [Thalassotalea]|uniref:DUF4097 family beta strand repeat-containing protein n=1 Tax=Thalassotalea castellviae TaxID=3075612 RepID=A0ABU2ZZU3_9GAMM|nr:DUF4097 family beta strand repeat-containing protein [Thalassotalea sp. W431]MDT0602398.1 DUF4097 family beta strand repeat-containing protein [Thalassotalea sp. W431]
MKLLNMSSVVGFVLLTSILSGTATAEVHDEITKIFTVAEPTEFRLDNVNGDVEIRAWDNDKIKVNAVIKAKNQAARERITIEMNENDRGISVETHYKKSSGWGRNHSGSVEYTVMVPRYTRLSSIDLVNGSLIVEGVEGEVNIDLVNGSIEAKGLTKDSEINSVNGSIVATYQSLSNDLRDISIDTVNGRIELNLPESINADVEIDTMNGSIRNDFGLSVNKNMFSGKNLHGTIGSGDIRISIESVNGGVKLRKN